jgi:hypothetical protein
LSRRRKQFNLGFAEWLLDHLIRSRQHIRRDRQTDLLRRLQIDHQLKPLLERLLRESKYEIKSST